MDVFERIRAIHVPEKFYTTLCSHDWDEDHSCVEAADGEFYERDDYELVCRECSGDIECIDADSHTQPWPCPTIQALGGEQ